MSYKEMFQHMFDELYGDSTPTTLQWLQQYTKQIAIGGVVVLAVGGGAWYFVSQRSNAQIKATAALFDTLQEYHDAQRAQKDSSWKTVEETVAGGLAMFGSSGVGTYFHALAADSAQRAGKTEEAQAQMAQAAAQAHASDPVKDLYAITAARMQLDQSDVAHHEKALHVLASYAQNKNSLYQDMAQYYLGLWYMQRGNVEDARRVLSDLIRSQEKCEGSDAYSPWAESARELIDQVAV